MPLFQLSIFGHRHVRPCQHATSEVGFMGAEKIVMGGEAPLPLSSSSTGSQFGIAPELGSMDVGLIFVLADNTPCLNGDGLRISWREAVCYQLVLGAIHEIEYPVRA
jgi:hypothetical protein